MLNYVEEHDSGEKLSFLGILLKNSLIFYLRKIALVLYSQVDKNVALCSKLRLVLS